MHRANTPYYWNRAGNRVQSLNNRIAPRGRAVLAKNDYDLELALEAAQQFSRSHLLRSPFHWQSRFRRTPAPRCKVDGCPKDAYLRRRRPRLYGLAHHGTGSGPSSRLIIGSLMWESSTQRKFTASFTACRSASSILLSSAFPVPAMSNAVP